MQQPVQEGCWWCRFLQAVGVPLLGEARMAVSQGASPVGVAASWMATRVLSASVGAAVSRKSVKGLWMKSYPPRLVRPSVVEVGPIWDAAVSQGMHASGQ